MYLSVDLPQNTSYKNKIEKRKQNKNITHIGDDYLLFDVLYMCHSKGASPIVLYKKINIFVLLIDVG